MPKSESKSNPSAKPNLLLTNRLGEIRKSRGMAASALAKLAGVSRQTVYAIEAGSYIPNTEVSLKLARSLEVSVEDLFALPAEPATPPEHLRAELLANVQYEDDSVKGRPVRLGRVGRRWVGVPVSASPYYLPEADGVVASIPAASRDRHAGPRADVLAFAGEETFHKRLLLAGCDPATNLLARMVERTAGVEIVSAAASSRLALEWLRDGKVHIAGSHLEDPETGEFNLPYLAQEFPGEQFAVVTFARWEEGLVTARGNPKHVSKIEQLARKGVRFINREPGSGSRGLLDKLLEAHGVEKAQVAGYERVAFGHLAAAYAVYSGDADCCLATRSAARTFDLDFTPLHTERYDLVMRKQALELPAVAMFLDVLQRATLRRQLEIQAGYDTAETGSVVH